MKVNAGSEDDVAGCRAQRAGRKLDDAVKGTDAFKSLRSRLLDDDLYECIEGPDELIMSPHIGVSDRKEATCVATR